MAEPTHTTSTDSAGRRTQGRLSALPLADLCVAARLAGDRLRPALRADVASWRCRASAASSRAAEAHRRRHRRGRRAQGAVGRGGGGLRKGAGRCPRRAQAIANETRDKQAAAAEARRKTLEDELNAKLAEAEKTIAATKTAAMSNVRGIAEDATARDRRAADRQGAERQGGRRRGRRRAQGLTESAHVHGSGNLGRPRLRRVRRPARLSRRAQDDRQSRSTTAPTASRPNSTRPASSRTKPRQLLAEYQRKRKEAEGEAQDIIAGAKAEAERMAAEAKAKIEEFVARRTKMAETKIAQAEAQADRRCPCRRCRRRRRRRREDPQRRDQGQARAAI